MKYYFDKKLAPLSSAEVDVRIEEALKYLNMAVYCNGDIPFSKEIDDVWHYWILETAEYQKLCAKLHGRTFLHHSSNDYAEYFDADAKNRKIDLEFGISILSSYVRNYGSFEPDRVKYWLSVGAKPSEKVAILFKKYMAKFEQQGAAAAPAPAAEATASST